MTALQRFGFKTRKDGSEVYRDAEKVVVIHPTECGGWAGAIQLRRWCGGVHHFRLRASTAAAIALFIFDWLADRNNVVKC